MFYLASRSPRRQALLQRLEVPFQTLALDVPEVRAAAETPEYYVQRVALDKAQAGLAQVLASDPQAVVLGADTEVVFGQRVFGKPADADEAEAMLTLLSGQTHQVLTAVVLVAAQRQPLQTLVASQVSFAALEPTQIRRYADSGEPMGKAGGYAIQGQAECFITHLAGSYSGVMGLPLFHTSQLLAAFGVH
ncbi:Maf-like protein [Xanthomonas maliensis]|uniref:Maf-like protein n=2 Tax=Xanthomonas maliensis TaxID=1321368 RepID=UPI001264BE7F|nr:Maf-like protein [Xanthomonas maliensis]KAB7770078.1 septum formation inhibitor Maf [Xanthomonas maliensis]